MGRAFGPKGERKARWGFFKDEQGKEDGIEARAIQGPVPWGVALGQYEQCLRPERRRAQPRLLTSEAGPRSA